MRKTSIFTMMIFAQIFSANAAELSFDDAWNTIYKNSHSVKAAQFDQDAAKTAKFRGAMGWMPQVYVAASAYQTNDPANIFMGKLKQEKISVADFNPSELNEPETSNFYTGAVGVELPLFQGGQKYREYRASKHFHKSAEFNKENTKNSLYASVVQQYASLIILNNEREQIQETQRIIDGVSKHYQLNSNQNPMGKSGALGLKAISNKLNIMLMENTEHEKSIRELMAFQGVDSTDWEISNISFNELLSQKVKLDLNSESYGLMSSDEQASGMRQNANGAASAHLPYISAFAQNDVFHGDRGTGNGYTVGLSFKWSLYDPSTQGIQREAEMKAAAGQERVNEMRENEQAARISLMTALESGKESVLLMQENYELVVKQTTETNKMFKNGAINVLQWMEIISRRTDTIRALRDTQLNLLQLNIYSINQSKFEI